MAQHGTYTGATQGAQLAQVTNYMIEIWVSNASGGTYELLDVVKATGGEQTYVHKNLPCATERWYKLRYRTPSGFFSDFNTAKKGKTLDNYEEGIDGGTVYGDKATFNGVIAGKNVIVFR